LGTALFALFSGIAGAIGGTAEAIGDGVEAIAAEASAVTQRLINLLAPNGVLIGAAGSRPWIRELFGGSDVAEQMFQDLTEGGTPYMPATYTGTAGYMMRDGSWIGYRPISESELPTIDLNIPYFGETLQKLKFLSGD
jgi:hypothetical protein